MASEPLDTLLHGYINGLIRLGKLIDVHTGLMDSIKKSVDKLLVIQTKQAEIQHAIEERQTLIEERQTLIETHIRYLEDDLRKLQDTINMMRQ